MVKNHYRWDFVGLSTDTKPTPENSEKVTNGSTYYCSDTSKLYVWCDTQWYERKPLGGGGGGTSYTAGDGIDITNHTISVDTDTIQERLTAGTNITIDNNVISAVAGGGIKTLTADDYNYDNGNTGSYNTIGLWLLDDGAYILPVSGSNVSLTGCLDGSYASAFNTSVSGYNYKYLFKVENYCWFFKTTSSALGNLKNFAPFYYCTLKKSDGWFAGSADNQMITYQHVVQTTGSSTSDVMSQKAVTDALAALETRIAALEGA